MKSPFRPPGHYDHFPVGKLNQPPVWTIGAGVIDLEHHRRMTFLPPLEAEQECALNQARLAGDTLARSRLILSNLRLVWHLAKRYAWSGIGTDDLFSSGILGLIAAVDSYNCARGRLVTHACMHIRKEMLMLIAAQRSLLHLPTSVNYQALLITRAEAALAAELGRDPTEPEIAERAGLSPQRLRTIRQALATIVSLDDTGEDSPGDATCLLDAIADDAAESGDRIASASSRVEWLATALHKLSPREQKLLRRHFGLDGRGGLPLAHVAAELGISRERLRQIELTALRKLRHLLQADDAHLGESLGPTDWDQLLREAGLRLPQAA